MDLARFRNQKKREPSSRFSLEYRYDPNNHNCNCLTVSCNMIACLAGIIYRLHRFGGKECREGGRKKSDDAAVYFWNGSCGL